jgi:hypothetical protein
MARFLLRLATLIDDFRARCAQFYAAAAAILSKIDEKVGDRNQDEVLAALAFSSACTR